MEELNINHRELADVIAGKKRELEADLLRAYGHKFDVAITVGESGRGNVEVFVTQPAVQTGDQLGLLGRDLYALDLHILMHEEPYGFGGWVNLVHHYASGGRNLTSIGYMRYDMRLYDRDGNQGQFSFAPDLRN